MSVELRKARKDDQLFKKRNLTVDNEAIEALSPTSDSKFAGITLSAEQIDMIMEGMNSHDPTVQLQATQACRKMLSREKNPPIDMMIDQGVVPRCIEFLSCHDKYALLY